VGSEFHVDTTTTGSQANPSVTALSDGGFLVSWSSDASGGTSVVGQRFSAAGAPVGSEFQINTQPGASFPDVTAVNGGGFVATWWSGSNDVHGQLYAANGA